MKTEVEKDTLGTQLESSTSGHLEKVSWGTQSREGASRKEDSMRQLCSLSWCRLSMSSELYMGKGE